MKNRSQYSLYIIARKLLLYICFSVLFTVNAPTYANEENPDAEWTIQLQKANIRNFITQVADITGKAFIVEGRVKADITVISHTKMTADEVYELFLAVLHVYGYAAVPSSNGIIKITSNNKAKQDTIRLDKDGSINGEELITRVIPIKNMPATELIPILRPMIAQHGHLAGVPSANAIIISDHAANIHRMLGIVEQIDGGEREEIEVIQLEEAWVTDVVKLLTNLTPVETGSVKKTSTSRIAVRVVADERTNRLIIKGGIAARERVRKLIRELDTPTSHISGSTRVIYLQHADAKKVGEILNGLISGSRTQLKGRAPGGTDGYGSSNTKAFIRADDTLNALVVRADPNTMDEVQDIIRLLDVRRAQVLIEAAIIEVYGDAGQALGIQWGFGDPDNGPVAGISFSNFGNSLNSVASAAISASGSSSASSLLTGASIPSLNDGITLIGGKKNSKGDVQFGSLLQALASSSNTNILSTPSIVTLDNQEAQIVVGQTVPFTTGSSTNNSGGLSSPFTTVSRENVGLTLKVIPHIHEGDILRLEIDQESSNLTTSAEDVEAGLNTITAKRSIKTTILAEDQETIVLGGLVQDDTRETVAKVPLLGDIPILGHLFRSTDRKHIKRNLMVFLKATIIRDSATMSALTHLKYQGIQALKLSIDERDGSISIEKEESNSETVQDLFKSIDLPINQESTQTNSSENNKTNAKVISNK